MKLPESVKIGPHEVDIFQTPEISEYYGKYHYGKNLIEITTEGVAETILGDTLIHEILHAIWKQTQMNELLGVEDGDKEEAAVHVLGAQIYQLLRENPKLVKFIMGSK